MIRILICDDHLIVREGLKQVLSECDDFHVLGETANGADALQRLRTEVFDVVLLDINMPGRDGLDVLKQIRREKPRLPVLMLSIYPDNQYAVRALRMGAAGYLHKSSGPQELSEAIRRAHAGRIWVSAELAERLAADIGAPVDRAPHEQLSHREYQVFSLLASGKRVGEIADALSISANTVSTYRARVLEKFRLTNDVELVHYAIRHRVIAV
jgi:two-component system, NarL family, invasion response regulator UvrY